VKIFGGKWRNIAPIRGRRPDTLTSSDTGNVVRVIDERAYFGERFPGVTIRVIEALKSCGSSRRRIEFTVNGYKTCLFLRLISI